MEPQYKQAFSLMYYSDPLPRYYDLFRLQKTRNRSFVRAASAVIRRAIDAADDEVRSKGRLRLRADAKYFMFVNFMQMIVVPLAMSLDGLDERLLSVIGQDIRSVIQAAAENQLEAGPEEISGHSVLETIAKSWRTLNVTKFRIWGEE